MIRHDPNAFQAAAKLLTNPTGATGASQGRDSDASQVLRSIWGEDVARFGQNRAALLRLAARCRDSFVLQLPNAPKAFAFGAMIAAEDFGLSAPLTGVGGRGDTLARAFESTMGEAAEQIALWTPVAEAKIATAPDITEAVVADWMAMIAPKAGGRWIECASLLGEDTVHFPADLIFRSATSVHVADSAGLAAGRTVQMAIQSALLEVVERDAVALWWWGGAQGRRVALQDVSALADRSGRSASRPWWLLDITGDTSIPVLLCLSATQEGTEVVVGAAADLDPIAAAQSAFLEMCQMELASAISLARAQQSESEATQRTDDVWTQRRAAHSTQAIPRLLGDVPGANPLPLGLKFDEALQKINACDLRPYWVDLSPSGLEIPVVRVIVAGAQPCQAGVVTDRLARMADRNCVRRATDGIPLCPI